MRAAEPVWFGRFFWCMGNFFPVLRKKISVHKLIILSTLIICFKLNDIQNIYNGMYIALLTH